MSIFEFVEMLQLCGIVPQYVHENDVSAALSDALHTTLVFTRGLGQGPVSLTAPYQSEATFACFRVTRLNLRLSVQAKLAFVSSMMLNIDELASDKHMFMSLVEFYEAVSPKYLCICRCFDVSPICLFVCLFVCWFLLLHSTR